MEKTMTVKLQLLTADDLRDSLSTSGVFDMFDCTVRISYPIEAQTEELERMVTILESVINVQSLETRINLNDNEYRIEITEVPADFTRNRRHFT